MSVLPARSSHVPVERIPRSLARPPVDLELIVPAYNESLRLPRTLHACIDYLAQKPWSSSVVVVDNNSADRTVDAVAHYADAAVQVHVIGCSTRGKGAAVRRGIATSSARFVGFADADNATPINTLDTVMELLVDGHAAVIASRRAAGARYEVEQSVLRRGGGWLFRSLAKWSLPEIADSQCGFKFFDGPLVREVCQECHVDGFAFDVEILAHFAQGDFDIVEVPVNWSDVAGSTFSARRDGLRSMADLVRVSLHR